MRHTSWNDGWQFSLQGGAPVPVQLPHDFSFALPREPRNPSGMDGGWFAGGIGEYTKTFSRPEEERCALLIDGAQGLSEVWINGNRAAFHPYGYSPFVADLTPFLREGENALRVVCNTQMQPASRWYTGSGLYRDVELLTGPKVCIPVWGVCVRTLSIENGIARMWAQVQVLGGAGCVYACVRSPEGNSVIEMRREAAQGRAEFVWGLPANQLWTAETPFLWRFEARVEAEDGSIDAESVRFGIRTIAADPEKGLLVNGASVKLRGGCVHHDNGPLGACSWADAERRRVFKLKEAGFNAIRTAHNPPSTALLEACDALGLYVIDEAFDCWRQGKRTFDYHLFFDEWWERDLSTMLLRDRNHPSVILWSHGNEIPERGGKSFGWEVARALSQRIRALDDRPITHALCSLWDNPDLQRLQDAGVPFGEMDAWARFTSPCADTVDIVGYNYLYERVEADHRRFPNRLIAHTETFPEAAAPSWRTVEENDFVVGDFVWTAWDYFGEAGIGHVAYEKDSAAGLRPWPWLAANCGDISLCGQRRPQSYYREIVWGLRQKPYLAALDPRAAARKCAVSPWGFEDLFAAWTFPGCEGQETEVHVFARADECELFLNGASLGRKPLDAQYRCAFRAPYQPGEVRAVVYRDGKAVGEEFLRTAGAPVKLCLAESWPGEELVFATICVCDAEGNAVPYANPLIRVSFENACLLGLGSDDPASTEAFTGPARHAWRGAVLAVARRGEQAPVLRAWADGLTPLEIVL